MNLIQVYNEPDKIFVYDNVLSPTECLLMDHQLSQLIEERCRFRIPPFVYRSSKLNDNTDLFYWVNPEINENWDIVDNSNMVLDEPIVESIDKVGFYNVIVCIDDVNSLSFEYNKKVPHKVGRIIIFDRRLLYSTGPCRKSQIIYTRAKSAQRASDPIAFQLFKGGMREQAFKMSAALEEIVLEL